MYELACCAQVMLKDIADSKRLNSNIKALPTVVTSPVRGRRQDAASIAPLTSTVTSALFWPPQPQDNLNLPLQVSTAVAAMQPLYAKRCSRKPGHSLLAAAVAVAV